MRRIGPEKMIGLPKGELFLSDYDARWNQAFEEESIELNRRIGDVIAGIHHIGSTAVLNLRAKPIIDIAIELIDFEEGYGCRELLSAMGYKHRIVPELAERHYFSKGDPRTHQIHMFKPHSPFLKEQIEFRNQLRERPELALAYQKLKERLVFTHSRDKLAYAVAKTDFIRSVLDE